MLLLLALDTAWHLWHIRHTNLRIWFHDHVTPNFRNLDMKGSSSFNWSHMFPRGREIATWIDSPCVKHQNLGAWCEPVEEFHYFSWSWHVSQCLFIRRFKHNSWRPYVQNQWSGLSDWILFLLTVLRYYWSLVYVQVLLIITRTWSIRYTNIPRDIRLNADKPEVTVIHDLTSWELISEINSLLRILCTFDSTTNNTVRNYH